MGHWYTLDGRPNHYVPNASKPGQTRPTRITDARKLALMPSVTAIINVLDKPGLNIWKEQQILKACWESGWEAMDRQADDQKGWGKSIMARARSEAITARDKGIAIHKAVENWIREGIVDTDHMPYLKAVDRELTTLGLADAQKRSERTFCTRLGYGGTVDLSGRNWVLDFKSKDFDNPEDKLHWPENAMQLAAYCQGLDLNIETTRCINVFVSRNVPGMVVSHTWDAKDILTGWECFWHCLKLWQLQNDFWPDKVMKT